MKTDTSERILQYIKEHQQATAAELTMHLGISQRAVFKQLKKLRESQKLHRLGKAPKVFYVLAPDIPAQTVFVFSEKQEKLIYENFITITARGEMLEGVQGFAHWCQQREVDTVKMANSYFAIMNKYAVLKKDGCIDGTQKMKGTFPDMVLEKVYYQDFYSIEQFGKTKLGQLLLYAKQSQDFAMMKRIVAIIQPSIQKLIAKHKVDAVGFIPPTIKRERQLMREVQKQLQLSIPNLSLVKVKTPVIVPQKSLSKLKDRIQNAKTTIIVDDKNSYRNVLLIDDAVGSGATLYETARQLQKKGIATGKVFGFAIVGSLKGFEVISEV